MNALTRQVLELLGEGGAFARAIPGWRVSQEQLDYAQRVCAMLTERGRRGDKRPVLGTLEAATGIGKTFGYLVPLLVYASTTGRRVAVATYTLELLYAIHREALPTATRIVARALGQEPLQAALRVGMPEYVSAERVATLLQALPAGHSGRAALESLHRFALDGAGRTSGRLRDWLATGHALPYGVTPDQVQLEPWCSQEDLAPYQRQLEEAGRADIVLTTQASLLMHCMRSIDVISGEDALPPVDAVVVDEADRVPDMAQAVAGTYLPINSLRQLLSTLDNGRRKAIAQVRARVDAVVPRLQARFEGHGVERKLLHGASSMALRGQVAPIIGELRTALQALRKLPLVREDPPLLERVDRWGEQLRLFAKVFDGDGGRRASYISQSPVRGYLGLGVVAVDPGRMLSQLWRRAADDGGVRAVLLTSATLSPPGRAGMASFHQSVGIRADEHRLVAEACAQIEPARHGRMELVFADPRAPRPFQDTEDGALSRDWVAYVTRIILAARARGGRTLVLCGAYRDTAELAQALRDEGLAPIEAAKGNRPAEVDAFLSDPDAIWLTPTAWEGLDLAGAIQHLVVARIPYPNLAEGPLAAMQEVLVSRGVSPEGALRICAAHARSQTARRLRQGLGRPLRHPDDAATVWFGDSRFPLPLAGRDAWLRRHRRAAVGKGDVALSGVIPTRFRDQPLKVFALDATIWSPP